jgi:hypothetical protein
MNRVLALETIRNKFELHSNSQTAKLALKINSFSAEDK